MDINNLPTILTKEFPDVFVKTFRIIDFGGHYVFCVVISTPRTRGTQSETESGYETLQFPVYVTDTSYEVPLEKYHSVTYHLIGYSDDESVI